MTTSQIETVQVFEATMNINNPTSMPSLEAYFPPGYSTGIPSSHPDAFHERPHPLRAFSLDSTSSYSDMDDRIPAMATQERSQRSRRRPQPGVQQVKHRRTRSGCYTCRQRRIKCDETRPTCDRCRKGKRECNYPGTPTTTSKSSPKSKASSNEDESDHSDAELDEVKSELPPVIETAESATNAESVKTPSVTATDISHDVSPASDGTVTSPTTTTASIPSSQSNRPQYSYRQDSHHPVSSSIGQGARWMALPADVRLLLTYHHDSLTHHHYSFRHDRNDFLKATFLDFAINDESEALLYAVVAFASYHYTLACGESAIANFLSYYNKSIVLLSSCLCRKQPDIRTLLTVLQLATIEECLGDWANMQGHQKAAYSIITELFTPRTLVRDETTLQIIQWYMRFDIFHAMVSGREANLGREWFITCRDFWRRRARSGTHGLSGRVEELCATLQLLASDLSAFMSMAPENYNATKPGREDLVAQFRQYGEELETTLSVLTETERVIGGSHANESMLQAFGPTTTYQSEMLCVMHLNLDFLAVDLMMRHNLQQPSADELADVTRKIITMSDAIERSHHDPASAILNCRGSLVTASYFIPREAKYIHWARRKFAIIERSGCIYPAQLRQRILSLWGVDENEMWLPNDECTSPILESVRDFIQYRGSTQTSRLDAPSLDTIGLSG